MFVTSSTGIDRGHTKAAPEAELETLPGGGIVEWLEDRRIVVYRAPDSSRLALQALFDRAEEIIRAWPTGKIYLAVLDLSSEQVGATPYARDRGRGLMNLRPDLMMVTSMLMRRSVQAQFFQLIVRLGQRANRQMAVHFSHDEAVTWLKKAGGIG